MTVWHFLFGDDGDLANADSFKYSPYRLVSGAVEGGVDNLKSACCANFGVNLLLLNLVEVGFYYILLDELDHSGLNAFVKVDKLCSAEHRNGVDF